MARMLRCLALGLAVAAASCQTAQRAVDADALPSWNDTASKQAIVAFVDKVTHLGTPDFVPPAERIAVFDNDGTLWAEQPLYFQLAFAIDRVKALATQHPEWETQIRQTFAAQWIERAQGGWWYQDASGAWKQK